VTIAQFWFDPICPWTYVTYQWLAEVRAERAVAIRPKLLSLLFLNEGRPDERHAARHAASLPLERFLALVRAERGDAAMEQAYQTLATALFVDSLEPDAALITKTADAVGIDPIEAAAAAEDPIWDAIIRHDHDAAMALVGADVGSPVIALEDGPAFFGPVLARAPRGQEAGRVWDGCRALAAHPDFFELKRSRGARATIRFD
jgi:2-hydroxychromene-2-carboxylate isomerase